MALNDGKEVPDSHIRVQHADEIHQKDNAQNNDDVCVSKAAISLDQNSQNPNYVSDSGLTTNIAMSSGAMQRATDLLFTVLMQAEPTRSKILDHVHSSMDELSKLAFAGNPLWVPQKDEKYETLDDIEYLKQFGEVNETLREIMKLVEVSDARNLPFEADNNNNNNGSDNTATFNANHQRGTLQVEASRDMAYISMSPIDIVNLLMDLNQWSKAFYNLVSRASILGSMTEGVEGSYDGKLYVMGAELYLPTVFAPARECYFARYCKQLQNDMWGIVDVSVEKHFPSLTGNCRRRPSGCLIKGMPNGSSKVIWVEHVEVENNRQMSNNQHFRPLVSTCLAFGATRWLTSIVRHTEWCEIMKPATTTALYSDDGVFIPQAGRISYLNLADRMVRSFCADINNSNGNQWMQIDSGHGSADVRIMIKNNVDDPGRPKATTVVFSTSIWLKVSPSRLFNFLRHEGSRNQWDLLSRKLTIREFAYMNKGMNPGNRVSLMRSVNSEDKLEICYLQESYTDSTCSYVIYAPLDEFALVALANGTKPENVLILPSGFAILPGGFQDNVDADNNNSNNDVDSGTGSLLTIAFHVIESQEIRPYVPPESVLTMHKVITDTVTNIKDAVIYNNLVNNWED